MEFLKNKNIFVMGASGFLGKIMVEKILRDQPNVKKLYLLIRSVDENMAARRFYDEAVEKDLFRVLKDKWNENLNTYISEKICFVPGDISLSNLGLKDPSLLKEMKEQVEIIVNLAATVNFDERYDVAFGTNTLGAKNVLSFAKQCSNLEVVVHVSTAYVSGEREGIILETPCRMGESLNDADGLNIETEQNLVEKTLDELKKNGSTEETITLTMKHLGLQRAMMHGWPNTYTFTKAMGEMVVGELRDNLPLVIIRPTVITSTYKQPFPGWIEDMKSADTILVGYGKGKITSLPLDINSTIDLIPADMVVNAMIMAMMAHAHEPCHVIYHIGSSTRNSMTCGDFVHFMEQYFVEKPWMNPDGKAIKVGKVTVFNNMVNFHRYTAIRYSLLLKGLEFANTILWGSLQDTYNNRKKEFDSMMRIIELYRPYLFFKATFDDTETERLRIKARNSDLEETLHFDPTVIDWADYFYNIHIPAVVKYVIK